MKTSGYKPGSMYKRFYGSNMSRMNKQSVGNSVSAMNSYGSSIFSTQQSQSEGLNELIVKKVATRLQAEAQQKLKNAAGLQSLTGLGAFTDSSA